MWAHKQTDIQTRTQAQKQQQQNVIIYVVYRFYIGLTMDLHIFVIGPWTCIYSYRAMGLHILV